MEIRPEEEDVAVKAIRNALRDLRKRHLAEEAAHAPAIDALSRPFVYQGSEWKEKAEKLELELQQCYKAQSRLSEQLVVEVAELRTLKASAEEKESSIADLQKEVTELRNECSQLKSLLEEKTKGLELVVSENNELKIQIEEATLKAKTAEAENKMLIDRWLLLKMQDAERLNEANALYEDMVDQVKVHNIQQLARQQVDGLVHQSDEGAEYNALYEDMVDQVKVHNIQQLARQQVDGLVHQSDEGAEYNALYEDMVDQVKVHNIQQLARQQVDGLVHQSDEGAEYYLESTLPAARKNRFHAHDGGCTSLLFEHNYSRLISGGQDRTIKMWDTATGSVTQTLHGSLGSILDLAVTPDNKTVIGASSSNQLYVWEVSTGRIRHTLTGHTDKVCAVSVSRLSGRHIVSTAYDRTIKFWDLQKGYCTNTIMFPSNCNTVCFSIDGHTICSGHVDGHLRLWDIQTGKLVSEVAAHSLAVTSISLSRNGTTVVTSGRDNMHNLFDIRTLEVCGTLKAGGHRVASNWSRSCMSPDDNYVAAGSADGSVSIWSVQKGEIVSTRKEHGSSVLCCTWSDLGKPLATSDKNGVIYTWV